MAIIFGTCDFCGTTGQMVEVVLVEQGRRKGLACIKGACWVQSDVIASYSAGDISFVRDRSNPSVYSVFETCDSCGKKGRMLEYKEGDESYFLCESDCLYPQHEDGVEVCEFLSQEWLDSADPVADLFADSELCDSDPVLHKIGEDLNERII